MNVQEKLPEINSFVAVDLITTQVGNAKNFLLVHYYMQQLAKIRVFKVDYFILPLFFGPKLRSGTYTYFSNKVQHFNIYCGFKFSNEYRITYYEKKIVNLKILYGLLSVQYVVCHFCAGSVHEKITLCDLDPLVEWTHNGS